MILVDNYIFGHSVLCLLLPLLGLLGEYAEDGDLEKLEFRAFLLGLGFGLFFTALLGALTLGSLGSEGRTFFEDLAAMDWNSMKYALLGGIVWNFGNIFSDGSHRCGRYVDRVSHWRRLSLDRRYNF